MECVEEMAACAGPMPYFQPYKTNAPSSFVSDFIISNLKVRNALDMITKLAAWLTF